MTLGSKLQSVHSKVNTKLGFQDATIVFRSITKVKPSTIGLPYTSVTNSDITVTSGIKVDRVKAYEVANGGIFRIDDIKLIIPGSLVTEAQLKNSQVIYNSVKHSIVNYRPLEIYSGVVVNWLVVVRAENG